MSSDSKNKVKRTFKISVIVDRCKKEFTEGMGVGVLATEVITFNLPEKEYSRPMFALSLQDRADRLREEMVKTSFEEIEC